jgi:DNA polymerase III delta subunit
VLGSHVSRIRECQALEANGVSAKDAAVRLKRNPYYVGKLYAQARNFSPEELREVTVRLADLDMPSRAARGSHPSSSSSGPWSR